MMKVIHPGTEQEFNDLIRNKAFDVSIVDFSADWCGPCKNIAPLFDELAKMYTDIQFIKVNVDELPDVSCEAKVRAMPTFILYKNGKITEERIEGSNRAELLALVRKHKKQPDEINSGKNEDKVVPVEPVVKPKIQDKVDSNSGSKDNKKGRCTIL